MKNGIFQKIKRVEIQGAINIAKESLKYLKKFGKKYGFGKRFEREMEKLVRVRPTAVVLHNVLEELKKERSVEKIDELLERLEAINNNISEVAQKIIPKSATVLTYCHSTEVISCLVKARKEEKNIRVYAGKTEPLHQGLITVKELAKNGIKVTLINDNACGYFMKNVDLVLVGTDAIRKEGIVNKIGTSMIAIVAKEYGVPFYSVGSYFKLDRRKTVTIEERSWKEIIGRKIKGVEIRNPAFDITPWKYVNGVVFEDSIKTPKQVLRLLK
ncbi:MAG: hypothetical protein J7K98_00705 [Candidatus Aenigmarchaeota archaeon]|nr:hypothetical protein [Candidatus Aenigmarchaeota archaeon]